MPPAPLEFWYEFASPYSYIAAMRIDATSQKHGVDVHWRPFLLGPVFRRLGFEDSPFNEQPLKRDYMWRDVQRCCECEGLPFVRPKPFPGHSLNAARVALLGLKKGWCVEFSKAVYDAHFGQGKNLTDAGLLKTLSAEVSGEDGEQIWSEAMGPDNKAQLRSQTEHASNLGVFGAPTFIRNGELFWGNDRLELALTHSPKQI